MRYCTESASWYPFSFVARFLWLWQNIWGNKLLGSKIYFGSGFLGLNPWLLLSAALGLWLCSTSWQESVMEEVSLSLGILKAKNWEKEVWDLLPLEVVSKVLTPFIVPGPGYSASNMWFFGWCSGSKWTEITLCDYCPPHPVSFSLFFRVQLCCHNLNLSQLTLLNLE